MNQFADLTKRLEDKTKSEAELIVKLETIDIDYSRLQDKYKKQENHFNEMLEKVEKEHAKASEEVT